MYSFFRAKGIDCRGEIAVRMGIPRKGFDRAQFDLVIFEGEKAVCAIEVKNWTPFKPINIHTRQHEKYSMFGVPVYFVRGMISAVDFMHKYLYKEDLKAFLK